MIKVICIFILFCESSFACKFETVNGDFEKVTISGSDIYALFSSHTTKNLGDDIMRALYQPDPSKVISDLQVLVNDKHKKIVDSELKKRKIFISLAEEKKISWIGIEVAQEELKDGAYMKRVEEVGKFKALFHQAYGDHSEWTPELESKVLSLLYPPSVLAFSEKPELFTSMRIVALDDFEAKKTMQRIFDRAGVLYSALENNKDLDEITEDQFKKVKKLFDFESPDDLKPVIQQEREKFLSEIPSKIARDNVSELIDAHNELIKQSMIRDVNAADAALKQSGSGFITMGTNHGPKVKETLLKACSGKASQFKPYEAIK